MSYLRLSLFGFLVFAATPLWAATGVVTLSPDRHEIKLAPGESVTRTLLVRNDSDQTQNISLSVEDFMAGDKPDMPVRLLGEEYGRYSLRDYLLIQQRNLNFQLFPGQQRVIPIAARIPVGTKPGGYYAAVLASFRPVGVGEQVSITNRLGSLFFVQVPGEVQQSGALKEFGWYNYHPDTAAPLHFAILYENSGDVYLNPFGTITLRNRFTGWATSTPISPWFVLPLAIRQQEIVWPVKLSPGFYQATLSLNRGYGGLVDESRFSFVAGKKWVLAIALAIVAIAVFILGLKLKK
jgi:hypothetical protein